MPLSRKTLPTVVVVCVVAGLATPGLFAAEWFGILPPNKAREIGQYLIVLMLVAIAGIGAAVLVYLGRGSKCPACYGWFGLKQGGRREVGRHRGERDITRTETAHDEQGNARPVQRLVQVPVTRITLDCSLTCRWCGHTLHKEIVVDAVIRVVDLWYTRQTGQPLRIWHSPTGAQWALPARDTWETKGGARDRLFLLATQELIALGWEPDEQCQAKREEAARELTVWAYALVLFSAAVALGAVLGLFELARWFGILPDLIRSVGGFVAIPAVMAIGFFVFLLVRRSLRRVGFDIVRRRKL